MTKVQKYTPFIVIAVVLLGVGYSLLPFKLAGRVSCGPALFGSEAKNNKTVGFIEPDRDCRARGRSRLLVSAMIALVATGTGALVVCLKPVSPQCTAGNHDGCGEWWGNVLGDGAGFGCQCSCHGGSY